MFRVKGQDGFCPLGPVLVDAADLDPADLWLRTYVNGALVQEAHTGTDLIFSVAYQIADISRLVTLEAGRRAAHRHAGPQPPGASPATSWRWRSAGIGRLENTVVELDRELQPVGDPPRDHRADPARGAGDSRRARPASALRKPPRARPLEGRR